MKCNNCGLQAFWVGRNNDTQEDVFYCPRCNTPSACQHQFGLITETIKKRDECQTGFCLNCKEVIEIGECHEERKLG